MFQFFVEILSCGFCLVNFECDAYLAVEEGLGYGHPKRFPLIFKSNPEPNSWFKAIFLIYVSVSFSFAFLLLKLATTKNKTLENNFSLRVK